MTELDQILDQLGAEAEAATEGSWERVGNRIIAGKLHKAVEIVRFVFNLTWPTAKQAEIWAKEQQANAIFIAHSRSTVPRLCKALRNAMEWIKDKEEYNLTTMSSRDIRVYVLAILKGEKQ